MAAATRALRPREGTERDWEVFRASVTQAWEEGLDTLPMGEAMVRIGRSFVGWPYGPGTLEVAGEEDVVVNFEEFDCVTLVENVFALARFIKIQPRKSWSPRAGSGGLQGDAEGDRYRGGRVDGYASRLHYFSDWIRDNEGRGLVGELTQELGGEEDSSAIDFMTTHPEAYRQLADPASCRAMQDAEFELSTCPVQDSRKTRSRPGCPGFRTEISSPQRARWMVWMWPTPGSPTGRDPSSTSCTPPWWGSTVEISRLPLAERILRLEGQDGIRVVRPLDPTGSPGGSSTP